MIYGKIENKEIWRNKVSEAICENRFYFEINVDARFWNLAADMEQMQALTEIIISDGSKNLDHI